MTWCAEFPPSTALGQRFLTKLLRSAVWLLSRAGLRPCVSVQAQRRLLWWGTRLGRTAGQVRVEASVLGCVPCEWLEPREKSGWVVLYLHGGAFIAGSPQTHRSLTTHLARVLSARVCALDHRLAPEHPFPAARDDVLVAYRTLLEQGHAPERLVIAGDSAGGNLTLVSALRLRDLGLPLPAALVCFSPFTDLSGDNLQRPSAGDPLIQSAWLRQGAQAYCPSGADWRVPELSPHYADLRGLPPLLVQVGEDELLLRQSELLAEQARAAGVDCRLELYRRQWHVFQLNCGWLASADLALQQVHAFLRERGCP